MHVYNEFIYNMVCMACIDLNLSIETMVYVLYDVMSLCINRIYIYMYMMHTNE